MPRQCIIDLSSSLIHNSLFLSLFSFSLLFTFLDCSPPLFSRLPRYSTSHYIGPLVCWSVSSPRRAVCQFHFTFSAFMRYLSSLLLPKFPSDLFNHCTCPPASDWGSRLSGLISFHSPSSLTSVFLDHLFPTPFQLTTMHYHLKFFHDKRIK